MTPRSVVVCGAGLAGLSVAGALLDAGFAGELTVLDRRTEHVRDRTWCTWQTPGALGAFSGAVTCAWPAWRVVAPDGALARHRAARHPYVHLDPDRVHALGRARIEAAPTARLELGTYVRSIDAERGVVGTDRGELEADVVVDALATGSPAARRRPPGEVELSQRFVGWEVRTERPVFTPGEATLMDFAALPSTDEDDLRFLYVLPFDACSALVEDTSIGQGGPTPAQRRAALAAWLDDAGAGAWAIERAERGRLAMSSARVPAVLGPRAVAAGEAGGAVRGSSGYAFSRIQRHATALARALVDGTPPPPHVGSTRAAALDRVFLRALADDPASFGDHLHRLVERTSAERFARFMTDATSPADDARVMAVLARPSFAHAALRGVVAR